MFTKVVIFAAAIIAVNAGGAPIAAYAAAPALAYAAPGVVGAQAEHTVRGPYGISSFSHQEKALHSPYSHAQQHDTRVTNNALHAFAAPVAAYAAAPAYAPAAYAAPAAYHGAAYAAPFAAHGYAAAPLAAKVHSAPAYAAPAAYAAAPAYAAHGYAAAPLAAHAHHGFAAAPFAAHGYAAGLAPAKSLSYSPAPAVAHLSYSTPYFNYGY